MSHPPDPLIPADRVIELDDAYQAEVVRLQARITTLEQILEGVEDDRAAAQARITELERAVDEVLVEWEAGNADGRESLFIAARNNLYGVKNASGGYGWAQHVSRAEQDYIAWRLYQRFGVQPWRPYDGC